MIKGIKRVESKSDNPINQYIEIQYIYKILLFQEKTPILPQSFSLLLKLFHARINHYSKIFRGKIMGKKKSSSISYLYLLGMLLVVIGFFCPITKGKVFGSTSDGFAFIKDDSSITTISALLIFIGGCVGLLLELLKVLKAKVPCSSLLKLAALCATIAGGVILLITFTGNGSGSDFERGLNKLAGKATKSFFDPAVGFYLIIVGWVSSLVGYITKK